MTLTQAACCILKTPAPAGKAAASRAAAAVPDGGDDALRDLLDTLPFPVWLRGADLAPAFANRAGAGIARSGPAKALAMTAIDLLADGAAGAKRVLANSRPAMTREQYLRLQVGRFIDELYESR